MKKTITIIAGATLYTLFAAASASALTAGVTTSADVTAAPGATVNVQANAKLTTRIATAKERANQEIDRRTTALSSLNTRVQDMVRLSADEKASIATSIQNQISMLTTLKAKIEADTDLATLKTDIKSITQSYRIFMLVIPQGRITVAADKIGTVASTLTTFSSKLATRITAAQAAGKDVTALNADLSDMNAKIADATTQSNAAVSLVANLTPDNGDATKAAANTAALKSARADIQAALKDIVAARGDAKTIVQALIALHVTASASSTVAN